MAKRVPRTEQKAMTTAIPNDNQNNPKVKYNVSNHPSEAKMNDLRSDYSSDEDYRQKSGAYSRIVEEKPESYAVIQVVKNSRLETKAGENKYAKKENLIPPFTRFFLQQVSYAKQEKYQILETFGDFKIFF